MTTTTTPTESLSPDALHRRRHWALETIWKFEHLLKAGRLRGDSEWLPFLKLELRRAREADRPEDFCWSLLLAAHLHWQVDDMDARRELGEPMQRWARLRVPAAMKSR